MPRPERKTTQRLTKEEIIERFVATHGDRYDYSRVEYKNRQTKVTIGCPAHGWFEQLPDDHARGCGCRRCASEANGKKLKLEAKEKLLSNFREAHGDRYEYSLVEYVNSVTKVKIICHEHGPFLQAPAMHASGHGCPECAQIQRTASLVVPNETWLQRFKDAHGDRYDYSEVGVIRTTKKIRIGCPVHGVFEQHPQNHAMGEGCPKCAVNYPDTQETIIKKFIAAHGDRYDYSKVEYRASDQKVKIICPTHGEFEQSPEGHSAGRGCWKCGVETRFAVSRTSRSAPEISLEDFVVNVGGEPSHGYLPNSDNKWTFDIILPEQKVAVEFNGAYWHSYPRTLKGAHYYKRKNAEEHGFRLISVWEDDWADQKEKVMSIIFRAINGPSGVIGARKTSAEKVDKYDAKMFHEANHLQGFRVSHASEHFALVHNGDVVAVSSFDKKGTLHRYTVLRGLSIPGGLSKVVSAYRKSLGNLPIVTYCDRDYFTGGVYAAAGFEETGHSMTMSYVVRGKRVRREKYMKHKLPGIFGDGVDMSKREIEICADNNVFACWNSGTIRFTLR